MLDIGLEVKILRERMRISAKDLAERIGLSQSQMSRLEKGQRRVDARILARIAEVLQVDPAHFFRGHGHAARRDGSLPAALLESVGRELRSERRKRHLSAEELAARAGTTKAAILSIEEGKRELTPELAERVCKALKLPLSFLVKEQQEAIRGLEAQVLRLSQELAGVNRGVLPVGEGRSAAGIPLVGTLAEGYPARFDGTGRPLADRVDFLYLPGVEAPGAFAIHVVGDSMEGATRPSFAEGDWVVFAEGALRSRDFAFVRLAGEPPTFRQIFFDPHGRVRLQPLNLNHPSQSCARGEIVAMWRLVAHVARYSSR